MEHLYIARTENAHFYELVRWLKVQNKEILMYFLDCNQLFDEDNGDKNFLTMSPNIPTEVQFSDVSSTQKTYPTRSRVQNVKRNIFGKNTNEDSDTHSYAAQDAEEATPNNDMDVYEDSGEEYVPSLEDESDSDSYHSDNGSLKKKIFNSHSFDSDNNTLNTNSSNKETNNRNRIPSQENITTNNVCIITVFFLYIYVYNFCY